ncbi:hypothetical protein PLEOSDRAFT_1085546 [Pleurotus ostreatus PC15]|uniref:Uncharacterized protein n=1 Tax=Pleurotus ostreatus (strain PC15) TaxID=1137138 RepID=A0A067NL59_PLEO1|nr:hypothetical protein PLEOSDRAFT_1085546 [Pleurotus ostreatus PC15]
MLQHSDFSAWIETEGVPTQEYNVEITSDAEGPVVTCWIASEEAKTFSVNLKDASSASTCWTLKADDDDAYMHRSIDAKFGEITLSVWSTQQVKYRKAQLKTSAPAAAPILGGPIHEKSKKMGGHCISYGQPVPSLEKGTKSSATKLETHYWERVKCLVSFSFKYRPLASSERSPGPRDHSAEAHAVDTGEVDLLRKRLDEIDKPRSVKRESDAAEQKAHTRRKRVKTEGPAPVFISGFLFAMLVSENLSAWVEIEGIAAQEYNIKVKEDPKRVTCWIASEEGKAFGVHIKDTSCRIATCWTLSVDGVEVHSPVLVPRPKGESHLNVGEITLDIWTAQDSERTGPASCVQLPNDPVHEKSKKSGMHCIGLGAVEHEESATAELWDCIDHLATFSFKYRPLALLQANGIAPPPPPASASPDPEEIDRAVSAEEKELKHQMEIMQQRLAELEKSRGAKRVKEEPDTAAQRARKRVKRGPKSAFVSGEVIDLTSE